MKLVALSAGERAIIKAPMHIGPRIMKVKDTIPTAIENRSSRKNALNTNA